MNCRGKGGVVEGRFSVAMVRPFTNFLLVDTHSAAIPLQICMGYIYR